MVQEGGSSRFLQFVVGAGGGGRMCTERLSKESPCLLLFTVAGGDGSEHRLSPYSQNKQLMRPTPSFSLYTCDVRVELQSPSFELPGSWSMLKWMKDVAPKSAHPPKRTFLARHRFCTPQRRRRPSSIRGPFPACLFPPQTLETHTDRSTGHAKPQALPWERD